MNTRNINTDRDLDDIICAAISPGQPSGHVHAFTTRSQKSIMGNFSLLSVDQSHVGGALNKYHSTTAGKNIHVVLCGGIRTTPAKKHFTRMQTGTDEDLFMHLLTWFIKESVQKATVKSLHQINAQLLSLSLKKMTMIIALQNSHRWNVRFKARCTISQVAENLTTEYQFLIVPKILQNQCLNQLL